MDELLRKIDAMPGHTALLVHTVIRIVGVVGGLLLGLWLIGD